MSKNQSQIYRVAVTGHTSGIGLAICRLLTEKKYEIKGFSRGNNYDLANPDVLQRLVANASDCDVFINNAFHEWAQIDLLYALYAEWRYLPKMILNIGSNAGDGTKNFPHKYAVIKAALDKASEQLNNVPNTACRIVTVRPGWVDTPRIAHLNVQEPKLSADAVAEAVYQAMVSSDDHRIINLVP